MTIRIPDLTIGHGYRFHALTVFPLFCPPAANAPMYGLAAPAMRSGRVTITEAGPVHEVRAQNRGDQPVLFLEGEQLLGARQNRVVNTSVLLGAGSTARLPVTCSEEGRWHGGGTFRPATAIAPAGLRHVVKASVTRSVVGQSGFGADQSGVWSQISRWQNSLGVPSATRALHDQFDDRRDALDGFARALAYVRSASGVALAIGADVLSIDLFDRTTTCRTFWTRILLGTALHALSVVESAAYAGIDDVRRVIDQACQSRWVRTASVGLGFEFRSRTGRASALQVDGALLHWSAVGGGAR